MGYFEHGHGMLADFAHKNRIALLMLVVVGAGYSYYNTKSQGMRYARHAHFATGEESSDTWRGKMTSVPFNMYEMREKLAEAEARAKDEGYLGGFF